MARPEVKEKVSRGLKGKAHSQEHKDKISAAGMGRVLSEETREKISAGLKKRSLSGSTRACRHHGVLPISAFQVRRLRFSVGFRCRECVLERQRRAAEKARVSTSVT